MLLLKQDAETYLVFTLEWAKYPLVNTKVAVVCFADSIFVDGRDAKFRPACLVLSRGNIICVLISFKYKCPRLNNAVDLPFL